MVEQMPQRPLNHQKEDVSRRAFERMLPPEWQVHNSTATDYGVDLRLEFFSKLDGSSSATATGDTCAVQLKSTARKVGQDGTISERLKTSTLNYLDRLQDPALLCMALLDDHEEVLEFRAVWLHRFVWKAEDNDAGKVRIYWPESSRIDKHTIDSIHAEVQRFRLVTDRSGLTSLPIYIDDRTSPKRSAVVARVKSLLREVGLPIQFVPFKHEAILWIEISDTAFLIDFVRSSVSASIPETGMSDSEMCGLVLTFMARPLSRLGFDELALDVLEAAPVTDGAAIPGNCLVIEDSVARSRRKNYFLQLLPSAVAPEAILTFFHQCLKMSAGFHGKSSFSDRDLEEFRGAITRISEARGVEAAAAMSYSLANHLFNNEHDYSAAIMFYSWAAELDGTYVTRGYFNAEMGATHFENGAFEESAKYYRAAVSCHDVAEDERHRNLCRVRLADALAHAGNVGDAILELEEVTPNLDELEGAPWVLLLLALKTLELNEKHLPARNALEDRISSALDGTSQEFDLLKQLIQLMAFYSDSFENVWPLAAGGLSLEADGPFAQAMNPILVLAWRHEGSQAYGTLDQVCDILPPDAATYLRDTALRCWTDIQTMPPDPVVIRDYSKGDVPNVIKWLP
ncbi:DUF4365 domain-containing protein [Brachybacterium sp. JHP9]|uniref:DUF4365 domain-containing protein n=1 Tax=Brachybacterium equifaecis TaxID=2910770 RepID=A0ABT0R2U7_9MICO|nr:DUF4365 domain-containing protein [Brachybacterium equifaecis]MCL6424226.1 DUF4365 domain-containing protein [Brachybacterium equifaecis]